MNKRDRGILIGMVLGDATLSKTYNKNKKGIITSYNVSIKLIHSAKQKEYLEHKVTLLKSIFGGKDIKIKFINNSGYPGYVAYKCDKYLKTLRSWIYKNGTKTYPRKILNWLTPEGIALWYMDDGSLCAKKRNGKIHAYDLYLCTYETKEVNQVIIDYFMEQYGIKFTQTLNKGKYRLRCGTKSARRFIEIVKPYIIQSMHYKITMQPIDKTSFDCLK